MLFLEQAAGTAGLAHLLALLDHRYLAQVVEEVAFREPGVPQVQLPKVEEQVVLPEE
jgi:hypothetical protein